MNSKEKTPIQQKISENKEKFTAEKNKINREATLQKNRDVLSLQNPTVTNLNLDNEKKKEDLGG